MPKNPVTLPATREKRLANPVKEGVHRPRQPALVMAVRREKIRADQRAWLARAIQRGLESPAAPRFDIEDVIKRGRARFAARKRRTASPT
jgi:hypothetical protein